MARRDAAGHRTMVRGRASLKGLARGRRVSRAVEEARAARESGGQAIWIDRETGFFSAGSDPLKDGCALGI